jgi:hypothetical protein
MSSTDPEEWPVDPYGQNGHGEADWEQDIVQRWPLTWRGLLPRERWLWFERLWSDACALRERYRLALRSEWWADEMQVEVLAAFAAWIERYDTGDWDDPPGKLSLLFDLERVAAALREGIEPFHPERDRMRFVRHLIEIGCQPPPGRRIDAG